MSRNSLCPGLETIPDTVRRSGHIQASQSYMTSILIYPHGGKNSQSSRLEPVQSNVVLRTLSHSLRKSIYVPDDGLSRHVLPSGARQREQSSLPV